MFCKNCGNEIDDKAFICVKCGCLTDNGELLKQQEKAINAKNDNNDQTLGNIAKVFAIVTCAICGIYIIPLLWMLPMTIVLCKKLNKNQKIGTAFKVFILLFLSTVAGILLLCRKGDKTED